MRVLRRLIGSDGGFWVFAYGSLMWDPRFPVRVVRPARLHGWHRALCILSIANRGTPERPGLVVGLSRGGSCVGRALMVAAEHADATLRHLQEREMSTDAYVPRMLQVWLDGGEQIPALVFVARRGHPQFVAGLSREEQARLIVQGRGPYGSSLDYLRSVCRHLDECRIVDGPLHAVLALAEASAGPDAATAKPADAAPLVAVDREPGP
jgi:cation transport protein ChaC